jgi:hypothetical protein
VGQMTYTILGYPHQHAHQYIFVCKGWWHLELRLKENNFICAKCQIESNQMVKIEKELQEWLK